MCAYKYDLVEFCPNLSNVLDFDNMILYRISKNKQVHDNDFVPQFFDDNKKHIVNSKCDDDDKKCKCDYSGLSLYTDLQTVIKIQKIFKKIGNYIHSYKVTKECGKIIIIKLNEPEHVNLYTYKDINELEMINCELVHEREK